MFIYWPIMFKREYLEYNSLGLLIIKLIISTKTIKTSSASSKPWMVGSLYQTPGIGESSPSKPRLRLINSIITILSGKYCTVGMYFLMFTCNKNDIEWYDLQRSHFRIHYLLPRECIGKYCPRDNISWYTPQGKYQNNIHGPRGAKSPPSGNLSVLRGCISQYIPPLGSVRIHYHP